MSRAFVVFCRHTSIFVGVPLKEVVALQIGVEGFRIDWARLPELGLLLRCQTDPNFARKGLGYIVLDRVENSVEIGPEDEGFGGLQPTIVFDLTDKPKAGKLPLHIDVNPTDRDQDEELERLLAVGAKPADVGQTGEESWHVLADPEGNEFCLLRRRLSG